MKMKTKTCSKNTNTPSKMCADLLFGCFFFAILYATIIIFLSLFCSGFYSPCIFLLTFLFRCYWNFSITPHIEHWTQIWLNLDKLLGKGVENRCQKQWWDHQTAFSARTWPFVFKRCSETKNATNINERKIIVKAATNYEITVRTASTIMQSEWKNWQRWLNSIFSTNV